MLRERSEDQHRGEPFAGDGARRGEAVHPGHLDVEDREVGAELANEIDRVVAAAGLADDLVVLFFEDLLQVETDDRFVFGEHDAHGLVHRGDPASEGSGVASRSAAMRSRSASCSRLHLAHRTAQRVALAGLRVGVAAHLPRLGVGDRRLGHERTEPRVFGLGLEERTLLVGHGQLRAQTLQSVAHIDEAALQQSARHRNRAVYAARAGVAA